MSNTITPRRKAKNKAKFITLDGIDGAGKTTQLNVIRDWFAKRRLPVILTREPGGTPLGEELREILVRPNSKISSHTQTLLMFAARQQHLDELILPALATGVHVVSDRFTDATFAYQGSSGVPDKKIQSLETWVQGRFRPDLTILLDVPLDISVARMNARDEEKSHFEQNTEFLRDVRAAYLRRYEQNPKRYALIDTNREKSLVKQDIERELSQLFGI